MTHPSCPLIIRVDALAEQYQTVALSLAKELSLTTTGEAEFALQIDADGLQLQLLTEKNIGALRVDFVQGALAHRIKFGGGKGQMIAKAVGIQGNVLPTIVDATAGLGRDAFVLASLGCSVTMLERQPIIATLLKDGLARGLANGEVAPIIKRMSLIQSDAIELMQNWQSNIPQVVYLDPMFPERDKSALVKKEMRLFKSLIGADLDVQQLLISALHLASHRVVVKRPRKAASIEGIKPCYKLEGKSSRYDIYVKKSLTKTKATNNW